MSSSHETMGDTYPRRVCGDEWALQFHSDGKKLVTHGYTPEVGVKLPRLGALRMCLANIAFMVSAIGRYLIVTIRRVGRQNEGLSDYRVWTALMTRERCLALPIHRRTEAGILCYE